MTAMASEFSCRWRSVRTTWRGTLEIRTEDDAVALAIGEATVRMDGIGGVTTDEQHRRHGYSRRVLEAAVAHIRAGDAPLTTLYGIRNFYPKFGYSTVGSERTIRLVNVDEERDLAPGCQSRPGRPADLRRIGTLYNDGTREATGAVIRDRSGVAWTQMVDSLNEGRDEVLVVTDEADEVIAYAWRAPACWWMQSWEHRDPATLKIAEAFAMTPRAADSLLAACREWAASRGRAAVEFAIPPSGHLGMAAMLQDTVTSQVHQRDAVFMGRSTGVRDLMTAMASELSCRWRSVRTTWRGTLEIRTEDDAVALAIGEDEVTVASALPNAGHPGHLAIEMSCGTVARLALGAFDPEPLLARAGTSPDVAEVLAVLFPRRDGYIYPADRF
ncbi:MAG TPA: GNAT family N-acetyltransferase, partial [Thermomicrobiales bacterium]|nr:GNAT family N-acetyltransferase [Thermomicrobiales bacterium]